MFLISSPIKDDVNISLIHPDKNYSNSKYLFAYNSYIHTLNKILFNIPQNLNNVLITSSLGKINLYFKVSCFYGKNIAFYLSKNLKSYDYENITWDTCPPSTSLEIKVPWTYDKRSKYINLNLSEALPKLLSLASENYGFQLIVKGSILNSIFFSNRSICKPYLKVEVDKFCDNTPKKDTSYINAYVKNKENSTIEVKNRCCIPFNADIYHNYINLALEDSSLIIYKPGIYFFNWQLYLYAVSKIKMAKLSLVHNDTILTSNYYPSIESQIEGQTLINVSCCEAVNGYKINLVNTSAEASEDEDLGTIYLGPYFKPASIVVFSIS